MNIAGIEKAQTVKGFYGCKRVRIRIGQNDEELVVTKHFEEKLVIENICHNNSIVQAIYESIVITSRPRNVHILINNNFRNALYLYNDKFKAVMVLEEDTVSNEYRILKTVYTANRSGWMLEWLSQNPKFKRVSFSDYFRNKTLSLNDHNDGE